MLFDETELQALDKIATPRNVDTSAIVKKPPLKIKHWISLGSNGMLTILKSYNPSINKDFVFLETESKEVAQQILDAVPHTLGTSLYSKGNYYIPKWDNTTACSGWSVKNFQACNTWLTKMINILGYEGSKTYKILREPSDVISKIIHNPKNIEKREESQKIVEEALKLMDQELAQKRAEEEEHFKQPPTREQLKAISRSHF